MSREIRVFPDAAALNEAAAQRVVELYRQAVAQRGAFHVALAGGTTPQRLYQRLAGAPFAGQIDWAKVHVYFGDERCVAPDHADSNYRMAREALLAQVPIPPAQVHRMAGEAADPALAAQQYADLLARELPRSAQGLPQFDLVLLGMGDDGHTASLFPESSLLREAQRWVTAGYVEKLAAWRISLTLPLLNAARQVLLLVTGAGKARRLREVFAGAGGTAALPVQRVQPQGGLAWYLDSAAAGQLPKELYR